jgi:sialic acid synthase SpsE
MIASPVQFVAEVSSNHNQNLTRCLQFIDQAAAIGCSAVKFQLFKIDELFSPEALNKHSELAKRKEWELPVAYLPELNAHCRKAGIGFSCTPFYLAAVDELLPYVDFYKVASYELLWHDLLKECAQTGKPVVLSTGVATLTEIEGAVNVLRKNNCNDLTLLHCISGYPTPPAECNLSAIETIRNAFSCSVGWSDHSVNPAVIYRAVHRWNAVMVEFHLDLDRKGFEYKGGHCWLPEEIAAVIETIQSGLSVDGNGQKIPAPSEIKERDWRADPTDGLRPLLHLRSKLKG